MSILIDYMVGLGLDVVRDKVTNRKEQMEIRESLQTFIERQSKINELSAIAEEIDFQGLTEYISENLLDDVQICLFGNRKERGRARDTIIAKAVFSSQVKTELARKRVVKLISDIIKILQEFYRRKVSKSVLLSSAVIVDDIEDIVNEQLTEQNKLIIDKMSETIRESESLNIMSVDRNIQLIKLGKFSEVEANMISFFRGIGSSHILYPDYGYAPEIANGIERIISKPLSLDAVRKHPPKFMCRGSIQIDGQQQVQFDSDVIDYANRHQIPITINIQEAKKLLGDIDDPIQHEAEELVGKTFVIPPKSFPPPFPCSIVLNGNVEFDYVLLRTQEILEDGTIVVSNCEQDVFPFRISFNINTAMNTTDFNISTENPSKKDMIRYLLFMKKISCGGKLAIRLLSTGQNLMEGDLKQFTYTSGFDTADEEIAFLEKIISIEDYFGKSITLPNEIYSDDNDIVNYMADLINGTGNRNNWSKSEFILELSETTKNMIVWMDESQYSMSYVGSIDVSLYDERYHFSIKRTYEKVRVNGLEKLKKKVAVLDIGDSVKIEYLPGEENGIGTFVDILHTKP